LAAERWEDTHNSLRFQAKLLADRYGFAPPTARPAPVEKISKGGKPYLLATIRDGTGEAARWWKAFIAEGLCDEVRRLSDGEPIGVAGEIDCQPYEKGGEQRLNWSVVVDVVLSARKPKATRGGTKGQPKETNGSRSRRVVLGRAVVLRGGRPLQCRGALRPGVASMNVHAAIPPSVSADDLEAHCRQIAVATREAFASVKMLSGEKAEAA
jgi:hypothetical protein